MLRERAQLLGFQQGGGEGAKSKRHSECEQLLLYLCNLGPSALSGVLGPGEVHCVGGHSPGGRAGRADAHGSVESRASE